MPASMCCGGRTRKRVAVSEMADAVEDERTPAGLPALVEEASRFVEGNTREFMQRVWTPGTAVYRGRLQAIGFTGFDVVLDAGCGVGQWTYELARLNRRVLGIDFDPARLAAFAHIAAGAGLCNIDLACGSLERLPLADASVDAALCYSVIFQTDMTRSLPEFARVIRPGGRLYITGNGWGYFLRNLIEAPNRSAVYDPRRAALAAIGRRLRARIGRATRGTMPIPGREMAEQITRLGFTKVRVAPDGDITVPGASAGRPFFPRTYSGFETCWEILAERAVSEARP